MDELSVEVRRAEERIRPWTRETPVEPSPFFDDGRCRVRLKLENLQHTGSFKVRGALNKALSLGPAERERGCVAASTGNHGAAVAWALSRLDARGTVFVPEDASPSKVEAIRRLGGDIRVFGKDPVEAEEHARRYAEENDRVYISPYNDPQVIAGQGTIGVELDRQIERFDVLVASLGGGGLITGIAAYLRSISPSLRVVACSPENSPVMAESVRAGRILRMESRPTLSDGTAGGVEEGAITFDLCRELVDDYVLVSEEEIAAAMRRFIDAHHMLIEGAAGAALAGFLKRRDEFAGRSVALVICGANVSLDTLCRSLRERGEGEAPAEPS